MSEPAHGSVSAKAESSSPEARGGRYLSFCSWVPKVLIGSTAPIHPCTEASPATWGSMLATSDRKSANSEKEINSLFGSGTRSPK